MEARVERETPEILLVDDDSNDVAVALRAFRRNELADRVKVLRDGAELLEYLQVPAEFSSMGAPPVPKLILLDLKMPRLDGKAVLRALRSDPRTHEVPVVMVSWSDDHDDVRECYSLGANSYVVKSADASRPGQYLVDVARRWLDASETIR
jgi:two-component system response regulator